MLGFKQHYEDEIYFQKYTKQRAQPKFNLTYNRRPVKQLLKAKCNRFPLCLINLGNS